MKKINLKEEIFILKQSYNSNNHIIYLEQSYNSGKRPPSIQPLQTPSQTNTKKAIPNLKICT